MSAAFRAAASARLGSPFAQGAIAYALSILRHWRIRLDIDMTIEKQSTVQYVISRTKFLPSSGFLNQVEPSFLLKNDHLLPSYGTERPSCQILCHTIFPPMLEELVPLYRNSNYVSHLGIHSEWTIRNLDGNTLVRQINIISNLESTGIDLARACHQ